jgi:hypothetical protein
MLMVCWKQHNITLGDIFGRKTIFSKAKKRISINVANKLDLAKANNLVLYILFLFLLIFLTFGFFVIYRLFN